MAGLLDLLGWLDSKRRVAGRNLRDLIQNPDAVVDQWEDQAKGFNRNTEPVIQGGQLSNRPMTEDQIRQKYTDIALNAPMVGMTAWHGSPHKFDKFKAEAIGTGEGAQAYGHGLYLAEAPAVAQEYAGALSAAKATKPVGNVDLAQIYQNLPNDVPDSLFAARRDFRSLKDMGELSRADQRDFLTAVKDNITAAQGGVLYKTDIPDEAVARFLDWDKPLSQQAPEVQSALQGMVGDVTKGGFDLSRSPRNVSRAFDNSTSDNALKALQEKYGVSNSGGQYFDKNGNPLSADVVQRHIDKIAGKGYDNAGQLYSDLMHIVGSQSDISATLRNNGIPGIRYLDGGSRSAGQGSSNFVAFDPEMIRILERNGVATGAKPWAPGEYSLKDLMQQRTE